MEDKRDEKLWRTARKRAAFKRNLYAYIVVNLFLWAIWWFTQGRDFLEDRRGIPWPLWVMLGWGFALAFQYFSAYQGSRSDLAEQEYERLKQDRQV
ncbi:MAG TPA: 2TM domain-containing protein [Chitinophagaceae bacterium]